jgi:putative transposase
LLGELDVAKNYPYLMVDERYENNEVISVAVFVVIGIDSDGTKEILAIHIGYEEFKETWLKVFKNLKDRGLKGVKYIVGDYNSGLVEALKEIFVGVTYQRCFVPFTRNILSSLSKQGREKYISKIKLIWKFENKESALKYAKTIISSLYENNFCKAAQKIEESIEESLNYFTLDDNLRRKLLIERYNQELKRRNKPIRIFPNQKSCLRIMSLLSIAKNEEWTGRRYCDLGLLQIEEDSATLRPLYLRKE